MVLVKEYESHYEASVKRLLFEFSDSNMSDATWHILLNHNWAPGSPKGFILLADEVVVGFIGTVFSHQNLGGQDYKVCNLSGWIVVPAYRMHSVLLLFKALQTKADLFLDLTASPEADVVLKKLGFKVLETDVKVFFPDYAQESNAVICYGSSEIENRIERIDKQIYLDHKNKKCIKFIIVGEKNVLVIGTLQMTSLPFIRMGILHKFHLARSWNSQCYSLLFHVHYCSDFDVLHAHFGKVIKECNERWGCAGILVDSRLAKQSGPERYSYTLRLPVNRMYKGASLKPEEVCTAYTELTLLGVSAQNELYFV